MSAEDLVVDGIKSLTPPGTPSNDPRFKYDLAVSIALIGVILMTSLHVAWACGWLSFIGLTGFAQAETVNKQQTQMAHKVDELARTVQSNTNTLLDTILSGQIITAKDAECAAQKTKNDALASEVQNQISELQAKYMSINNGQSYPIGPCL